MENKCYNARLYAKNLKMFWGGASPPEKSPIEEAVGASIFALATLIFSALWLHPEHPSIGMSKLWGIKPNRFFLNRRDRRPYSNKARKHSK